MLGRKSTDPALGRARGNRSVGEDAVSYYILVRWVSVCCEKNILCTLLVMTGVCLSVCLSVDSGISGYAVLFEQNGQDGKLSEPDWQLLGCIPTYLTGAGAELAGAYRYLSYGSALAAGVQVHVGTDNKQWKYARNVMNASIETS